MSKPTRRDTLAGLAAMATAPLLPSCKSDGTEKTRPTEAPLTDFELLRERVDTVVILMMENRTFDHFLGSLSLEEGRTEVDGLTAEMSNPDASGEPIFPFRATEDCLSDPPHSWSASHDQFNDGANDRFVTRYSSSTPENVMGYYTRDKLPALYALSDAFVTCDAWFSSVMTSTWPNRVYSICAENGGVQGNDFATDAFPSIFTPLAEAGHSWGGFYSNLPSVILAPDRLITEVQMQTIDHFFSRAAAGTLPNVCFIEPIYGRNDDHPPVHPTAGQIFIQQIYDALAKSPQWDQCVFFITYDEHGGFFDHVPPPTTKDNYKKDGFDQMGFRVPSLIVGPWVKPGHVDHTVYGHTSMLAFIEHLFDIEPLTKRDAAQDPMRDAFDWEALAANSPLPPVALDPIEADEDEIYAPECEGFSLFATSSVTGQPELEQYVRETLGGTEYDLVDQTDAIYEAMLVRAEKAGVLIRRGGDG